MKWRATLAALCLVACGGTQLDPRASAERDKRIHWPSGFEPEHADTFAHNHRHLHATCLRVWQRLVRATEWPAWYANASDVHIEGDDIELRSNSRFSWNTFGFAVESQVNELVSGERLGWFGRTPGLEAYHTWLLQPRADGCDVITEEVGRGSAARELQRTKPNAIHDGHDRWLRSLEAATLTR